MDFLILCLFTMLHRSLPIPLSDFYPFGKSEGDSIVGPTADGASDMIMLNQTFPFFNGAYTGLYVS